jgi:hypothetical protein
VQPDHVDNFSDDEVSVGEVKEATASPARLANPSTKKQAAIPVAPDLDRTRDAALASSETADEAKAADNGHVFSQASIERAARNILCPVGDESIHDAIAAMEKICRDAMADGGAKWKTIVRDQDKFGLLVTQNHKFKIVFKTTMVLAFLSVLKFTLATNRPPAFLRTCELAREYYMDWIGRENLRGVWIPQPVTVYGWFRDFRTGRVFTHPEKKLHEKHELWENLDRLFEEHPDRLLSLVGHVKRTLRETKGELVESAYALFTHFASEIANGQSSSARGIVDQTSLAAAADSAPSSLSITARDPNNLLTSYKLEDLKWYHLYDWMENKQFNIFEVKGGAIV